MEWYTIGAIDRNLSYYGNRNNGACLPDLDEEVLFCTESFNQQGKDIYFVGKLVEKNGWLCIESGVLPGTLDLTSTTAWARFNKPWTKNNTKLAVAFGTGPQIARLESDTLAKLEKEGYNDIIVFKYQEPCTFDYTWEYVEKNREEL